MTLYKVPTADTQGTDGVAGTSWNDLVDALTGLNSEAITIGGAFKIKASTSFTGELTHTNASNRVYTFPDATGTVALLEKAQTFTQNQTISADKKILLGTNSFIMQESGGGGSLKINAEDGAQRVSIDQLRLAGTIVGSHALHIVLPVGQGEAPVALQDNTETTNLFRIEANGHTTMVRAIVSGAASSTEAAFQASSLGATTNFYLLAKLSADTVHRFAVAADGKISWGSGSATRDVELYRNGANILKLDDSFEFADAGNIIAGTITGTKIGTTTTQKLGFWNATPVVQQAGIADADGTLADVTAKFNSLLAKLETYGLLAVA